ncbi:MAG: ABC transporter permease [Treponema sp.]|nr:ABC transporter permease [Treponema sp.]
MKINQSLPGEELSSDELPVRTPGVKKNSHSPVIALFLSAFLLCLGGLCVPAFMVQREVNGSLLMILPAQPGSPKFDVQKIEEYSENEFLITYQIPGTARVSLPHGEFPVLVIGTNSCYSNLLLSVISEGSFFSKQAWKSKQRHAVLNEKAAFTIFGSSRIAGNQFKIQNETWLVSGVINDGNDDKSIIYIPSSVNGGAAGELLALMTESSGVNAGYNEAYIKNSIKTLGVHEGNFSFYNLGVRIRRLWERVVIALLLFTALFFISLMRHILIKFFSALADIKKMTDSRYIGEILRDDGITFLRLAFLVLAVLLLPSLSLVLFIRMVSVILPWQDIPSLGGLNHELFYPYLVRLYNFELVSGILFVFTLVFLAAFFVAWFLRPVHSFKTTAVKVSS